MDRFWTKVNKIPGGCWEWNAYCDKRGYGIFRLDSRTVRAHRLSAFWAGILPSLDSELLACHHCDNPKCVNPEHLFAGTDADNAQDRIKKGREHYPIGETNPRAKLTENDILAMRQLVANGIPRKDIASQYEISLSQVNNIVNRKHWSHI